MKTRRLRTVSSYERHVRQSTNDRYGTKSSPLLRILRMQRVGAGVRTRGCLSYPHIWDVVPTGGSAHPIFVSAPKVRERERITSILPQEIESLQFGDTVSTSRRSRSRGALPTLPKSVTWTIQNINDTKGRSAGGISMYGLRNTAGKTCCCPFQVVIDYLRGSLAEAFFGFDGGPQKRCRTLHHTRHGCGLTIGSVALHANAF